ncbi:MAG: two-component system response regulator [Hyphomicrobiales bacterium]|nr:MAG: two-component system response regulator [Hyphomicrobiales bacterium]
MTDGLNVAMQPGTPAARMSLLLVEDDDADVMLVSRYLRRRGGDIALIVARDGEEALAMLRAGEAVPRPYVILTDLNMPGMSGHELIEEIRCDRALSNSVIFVISSSRLDEDIQQAYAHHVAGYLSKQMAPAEMEKSLRIVFDYCETVHLPS